MKKVKLILFLLISIIMSEINAQQVIAHRGFWKTNGSAQNSIASLLYADSIGCYGSEFDVRLSSDGIPVVCHDKSFRWRSIEKNTAQKLTQLKLKNGERLPSLESYLQAAKNTRLKLILELKTLSSAEKETEAVLSILALVKLHGLQERMEYISFSLHTVKEFIRYAPEGTPVYYLEGDLPPATLKELGCAGPDYATGTLKKNLHWIKEAHDLGLKVNVWTVNSGKEMQLFIREKVDFITTNEPLLLQSLIQAEKK